MRVYGRRADRGKKEPSNEPPVRCAEQPGQALNVDLCFVPEQHAPQENLPAVSGSSGHLVVERIRPTGEEPHWPGQVFAEAGLDYAEARPQYPQATQDRLVRCKSERTAMLQEPTRWRKEWEGRAERYRVREQRQQEEVAWKAAKTEWRKTRQAHQAFTRSERKAPRGAYQLAPPGLENSPPTAPGNAPQVAAGRPGLASTQPGTQSRLCGGCCSTFVDRRPGGHRQLYPAVLRFADLPHRSEADQRRVDCGFPSNPAGRIGILDQRPRHPFPLQGVG